jgi:glutathione S-transferase
MRLFQFSYSPYAAKVRKCLELKGLAFEVVEVPYVDRRELIALTGGSVHIPVLVDGPTVVTDSPRITAWLDERHAPSLRPGALAGPAVVFEQWADQVLEDAAFRLAAPEVELRMAAANGGREDARAMFRMIKERKFGPGCLDAWRAGAAELSARLGTLLKPLAVTLESQPFLLGERATLADAAVWGELYMVDAVMPAELARQPASLRSWYARVRDARG